MNDDELTGLIINAVTQAVGSDVSGSTATRLVELGVSSLLLFEFVSRLESDSGMEIPDSDMRPENFTTVGDVVTLMRRLSPGVA